MQNLTVIENALVPVYKTDTGEQVVYGTELHKILKAKSKFADWIKNRLNECDAIENEDFQSFSKILEKPSGGRPKNEYIIKLDTAKEMAMLERNEKGKQVRRYFIQVEKKYKEQTQNSSEEPGMPWFIRNFGEQGYIMLFRDFKLLTGVEIFGNYTAWKRPDRLQGGLDYNGWAWHTRVNMEEFKKEYGFDYGSDECMMYLYPHGIKRALEIYRRENGRGINQEAYNMITDGVNAVLKPQKAEIQVQQPKSISWNQGGEFPIQINIIAKQ